MNVSEFKGFTNGLLIDVDIEKGLSGNKAKALLKAIKELDDTDSCGFNKMYQGLNNPAFINGPYATPIQQRYPGMGVQDPTFGNVGKK